MSSPVCGANGETFPSRCHARSMRVSVDYLGECSAVPSRGTGMLFFIVTYMYYLPRLDGGSKMAPLCESITCPELDFPGCRTVIPYGTCCPICGMRGDIFGEVKLNLVKNFFYIYVWAINVACFIKSFIAIILSYRVIFGNST